MPEYRVLTGLDYGGTRREIGDVVNDIPRQSLGWLMEQGLIEVVDKTVDKTVATIPDATIPTTTEGVK